jgi:hypothetical protein
MFEILTPPILDPRNETELVNQALQRVFVASNGQLNDFSIHSPVRAIIEGQAFATAELLYYANLLPEALAIEFLRIAGILRNLGNRASVELLFTLSATLSNPFTVPAGYIIADNTGRYEFAVDSQTAIPAGQQTALIRATATAPGSSHNLAANTITRVLQPLAFLARVENPQPSTGGTEPETLTQTKTRGFESLRRRSLVSQEDYEAECRSRLGAGSLALAVGNLAPDKINYALGFVHCFVLNPSNQPLSTAQLSNLQGQLQQRTHISIRCIVSNMVVEDITIRAIAKIDSLSNPETVANRIFENLKGYLAPGATPPGQSVILKELEYHVKLSGVVYVQSVAIGNSTTNYDLQYPWSVTRLDRCHIELVGDGNNIYSYEFKNDD